MKTYKLNLKLKFLNLANDAEKNETYSEVKTEFQYFNQQNAPSFGILETDWKLQLLLNCIGSVSWITTQAQKIYCTLLGRWLRNQKDKIS